jgi:hypothetical protein
VIEDQLQIILYLLLMGVALYLGDMIADWVLVNAFGKKRGGSHDRKK